MYHLTVKKVSVFERVQKLWNARIARWEIGGEDGPKPKFHETVEDVVNHGLSHPDIVDELSHNGKQK